MKTTLFAIFGLLMIAAVGRAETVAFDDFDGGDVNLISRTIDPDNSARNGQFPGSRFDVFGITDRTVNFDFADDSAGSFPPDSFGILRTGKTDNVFGVEDLTNDDNTAGAGAAAWQFDISGFVDLVLSIDFAAIGDFESSNDRFVFSASIDGGATFDLFTSSVDEDGDLTYTFESGTTNTINDPLQINGTTLSNVFQTLSASIVGSGSLLTLNLIAGSDGGSEVFVFDNLTIDGTPAMTAIPEPASATMLGLGIAGLVGVRLARRRRPA